MKSEKDSNIDNANDMKLGQHQTADKHIYVTVGEHNGVQMSLDVNFFFKMEVNEKPHSSSTCNFAFILSQIKPHSNFETFTTLWTFSY